MSDLTSERLAELRRIAEAAKNRLRRQPGQLHSRLEAEGAIDKLLAEIERLRRELNDLQAEFEAQNSMLGKVIIENGDLQRERDTLADAFAELVRIYESEQEADEYGNVPRPEWVQRAVLLLGPDGGDSLTTARGGMSHDMAGGGDGGWRLFRHRVGI